MNAFSLVYSIWRIPGQERGSGGEARPSKTYNKAQKFFDQKFVYYQNLCYISPKPRRGRGYIQLLLISIEGG